MSLQIPGLVKNPKVLGAVLGGVVLIGYMMRSKGVTQNDAPVILDTQPDKELVALGIQSRMQDANNATQIALSSDSNATTLAALQIGANSDYNLSKLNSESAITLSNIDASTESQRMNLHYQGAMNALSSGERVKFGELRNSEIQANLNAQTENTRLSVQQNLGERQINSDLRETELTTNAAIEQA